MLILHWKCRWVKSVVIFIDILLMIPIPSNILYSLLLTSYNPHDPHNPTHNLSKPHPQPSSYHIFISYTLSYTYSYTYYNYLDIKKILFG